MHGWNHDDCQVWLNKIDSPNSIYSNIIQRKWGGCRRYAKGYIKINAVHFWSNLHDKISCYSLRQQAQGTKSRQQQQVPQPSIHQLEWYYIISVVSECHMLKYPPSKLQCKIPNSYLMQHSTRKIACYILKFYSSW